MVIVNMAMSTTHTRNNSALVTFVIPANFLSYLSLCPSLAHIVFLQHQYHLLSCQANHPPQIPIVHISQGRRQVGCHQEKKLLFSGYPNLSLVQCWRHVYIRMAWPARAGGKPTNCSPNRGRNGGPCKVCKKLVGQFFFFFLKCIKSR